MIKYKVKYCLRDDCRRVLTLDSMFDTITEAMDAALKLEQDPEIYTAWHEQVKDDGYILDSMKEVLE